jgi:hypothetical protein
MNIFKDKALKQPPALKAKKGEGIETGGEGQ